MASLEVPEDFTGFVGITLGGTRVLERSCPGKTSWGEVQGMRLYSLEYWWRGRRKLEILVRSLPSGAQLYYSHTAAYDTAIRETTILRRTIGYVVPGGGSHLTVIEERTGAVSSTHLAPA